MWQAGAVLVSEQDSSSSPGTSVPLGALAPGLVVPPGSPSPQTPRNTLRGAPAHWLVNDTSRSLDINRRITQGYIQLAHRFQALVDPHFKPGAPSQVLINWFGFAPHASQEAGKGMLGAHLARAILQAAEGKTAASVRHALERGGVSGPELLVAEKIADTLSWFGLSHDVAASLGTLVCAANLDEFADPRTLWTTGRRFTRLLHDAPGPTSLERAGAVVRTLEQLLLDGNVAIYSDIGHAGREYLRWRECTGGAAVRSAHVFDSFSLEGAQLHEAQQAWVYAREHAGRTPLPTDFNSPDALPTVGGRSLLVAAFALFEDSRQATSTEERNALIAFANNYMAWHEQYNAVQPAFTPPAPLEQEVARVDVMLAMTPLLRLPLGGVCWEFSAYTARQKERDSTLLTSKPTEYNWALFEDRWPGILDAFALGYQHPEALWAMPQPLIDSLDLFELE